MSAPGCRGSASGALGNIGNNGYSWSSAVSGTNGVFLNFNTQNLNPSNVNNRGHGLQLRCLSVFIPFADCLFCVIFDGIENVFPTLINKRADRERAEE
ncbi:hypothetical protein [uncultured Rikenella sp.]|uniref:hypothetical protein n=1 Tax=uncultured Rikenella sp. TaxID=368003 RepID=UPI0025FD8BF8|nr:hypothetical protein [uncultured Rikenella sp.]